MNNGGYYKNLTISMVAVILIVSLTPLLTIGAIIGYQLHTSYKYKVLEYLEEIIKKHRSDVNIFIENNNKLNFKDISNFIENIDLGISGDLYVKQNLKKNNDDKIHVKIDKDEYGKNIICIYAELKNNYILIFQEDESKIFSELYQARKIAVIVFFFGGLGIVVMSSFLAVKMVRHIRRADIAKEMMNEKMLEAGKLASLGELANGIAHEINNPVAIMVEEAGWIQDLLEDEELCKSENVDELRRSLNQIKNQGIRCKEITHKLLSFARKTDSRVKKINFNKLVRNVVRLFTKSEHPDKCRISLELDSSLPQIKTSPAEIEQVLINLINNSLYAIKNNKNGSILIKTVYNHDYFFIQVKDNGVGIDKKNIQNIFNPFFTTKPIGHGTGLGLSICYGIIRKMGGEIRVKSSLDKGTIFNIKLPIEIDKEN